MTPAEHYAEAERLLALGTPDAEGRALVHATLACATNASPPPVVVQFPDVVTPESIAQLRAVLAGESSDD